MSNLAVNVVVIQDNKILLTQREDCETWILPGSGLDDGESVSQAAIQETKEETGLDVELTKLVGIYFRKSKISNDHIVLYAAKPVGGEIKCQPGETIVVEWFSFDQIPRPLSIGHKRRIEDVINGIGGGVCVIQDLTLPNFPNVDRQELYALRDHSSLARQDFYLQMIDGAIVKEYFEVGNV